MVNIEYANAYSEVLEILKYISKEEYSKIPKNLIEVYEKNANKNYYFNYNPNKTLEEQNASTITKCIIAILFRDYWATESQRIEILKKQKHKRSLIEEEKRTRYDANSLFKNNEEVKNDNKLVIMHEIKWYEKIIKWFRKLLK